MYEIGHAPLMIGKTLLEFCGERSTDEAIQNALHCAGGLKNMAAP